MHLVLSETVSRISLLSSKTVTTMLPLNIIKSVINLFITSCLYCLVIRTTSDRVREAVY